MDNKQRFIDILSQVNRPGMKELIEYIEATPFFKDPASSNYHGNYEGGLCEHSLAVYDELVKLTGRNDDSVKIVALLHDLCKAGTYAVDYRNIKNEKGIWEKVPYYKAKSDGFPYGHGEKSVFLVSSFIRLTTEEILAIRWHMGPYEAKECWRDLGEAQEMYPLVTYTHFADVLASLYKA